MAERPARQIEKTANEARAGVTGHNVRFVLIGGLTSVVLVFGILWIMMAR